MKKIKFIISFLIIFLGFLIIGESHNFYIENFSDKFYNTNFFIPENVEGQEAFKEMESAAEKNNVVLFTYDQNNVSNLNSEIIVYGTNGIKEVLDSELKLQDREYKSVFSGDITFKIRGFKGKPNIKKVNDFYISGSKANVKNFKRELINKYSGGFPREGCKDNDLRNGIIFMWCMVISIILFFTFYDTVFQKKENLIKITMGENLNHIIFKNIIIDLVTFVAMFLVIVRILSKYTYVFFMFNITIFFFALLLFFNSLLYFNLYRFKIKEVFTNVKNSKKLLTLNYGMKSITTILAIFIISSNIALIKQSCDLYRQRHFFEAHSDYYYTNLGYKIRASSNKNADDMSDKTYFIWNKFYHKYFYKFHAAVLTDKASDLIGYSSVITNKNSYDYISKEIDELKGKDLKKDFYFLIPKNIKNESEIVDKLKEYIETEENLEEISNGNHFFDKKYNFDIIYYKGNKKIIAIDNMSLNGSKYVKNPVIIYNNMDLDKINKDYNTSGIGTSEYNRDIMYKISDKEFNDFIRENKLEGEFTEKTNVLETYKYHLNNAKRVLILNLIFSALIILLELIIIISIIRLEYEVNAIEISLKKVLGYTILEKNKKIIVMTFIATIISIVVSVILGIVLKISEPYFLALGGVSILFLEMFVIIFYIRKIEYSKVTKILKGGSL